MTREQYIRSNKIAYPLILLTCTIVIVTLLAAIGQGSDKLNIFGQIGNIVLYATQSYKGLIKKVLVMCETSPYFFKRFY